MSKEQNNWKITVEWNTYTYYGETLWKVLAIFRLEERLWKKILTRKYLWDDIKEDFAMWNIGDRTEYFTALDNNITTRMWIKNEPKHTTIYKMKKEMDFYRENVQQKVLEDAKRKIMNNYTEQEVKALENVRASRINALNWLAVRLTKIVDNKEWVKNDSSTWEVLAILRQLNLELWRASDIVEVKADADIKNKLSQLWVL